MVLIGRLIQLFLRVERTSCGEPECRCRNHNLLVVTRFGWLTFLAFMLASFLFARGLR